MSRRVDITVDGWTYTARRPRNRAAASASRAILATLGKPALRMLATLAASWSRVQQSRATATDTIAAIAEVLPPEDVEGALDLLTSPEVEALVFRVLAACSAQLKGSALTAEDWHDTYDDAADEMEEAYVAALAEREALLASLEDEESEDEESEEEREPLPPIHVPPPPAPWGPHLLAIELAQRYRLFPLPGGSAENAGRVPKT